MVGREAELQHLSEVFEAVRRGTALGAIVTGEAGIGKTRLLDEFVGSLPDEVVLARGQCWDTGVPGSPFVAVRGLLRDLAAHVGVETLLAAGGASGLRLATVVPELHRDPADRSSGPWTGICCTIWSARCSRTSLPGLPSWPSSRISTGPTRRPWTCSAPS